MSDPGSPPPSRPDPSAIGLCATCRCMRTVSNRRGSVFYRCGRADAEPQFPRYPALPVLTCPGYEREGPRGRP